MKSILVLISSVYILSNQQVASQCAQPPSCPTLPENTIIVTDCSPEICQNLANTLQLLIVANLLQNTPGGQKLALNLAVPLLKKILTPPVSNCGCPNPLGNVSPTLLSSIIPPNILNNVLGVSNVVPNIPPPCSQIAPPKVLPVGNVPNSVIYLSNGNVASAASVALPASNLGSVQFTPYGGNIPTSVSIGSLPNALDSTVPSAPPCNCPTVSQSIVPNIPINIVANSVPSFLSGGFPVVPSNVIPNVYPGYNPANPVCPYSNNPNIVSVLGNY